MKFIAKLFLLGLFLNCQIAYSQTNADKAKAAYFKADEQYQANNYQSCIDKLNEAVQLLGESNARIQYLMVKSYNGLGNYFQVKIELRKYFSFQPNEDEWYKEMLLLSDEIDIKIKQIQEKELLEKKRKEEADLLKRKLIEEADLQNKKDDGDWSIAVSTNTSSSYENYLYQFPSGKHVKEAKTILEKIYWDKALTENTISSYNIYIAKYPYGWGDVNRIIIKYMFVPLIIIYVSLFKETHVINGGNIYA